MYDPYFKRSVVPIRKNVTFIPFRIDGTARLVRDHAMSTVIAKTSGWGERGPAGYGVWSGSGNEIDTFYLSSKKRLCRRSLASAANRTLNAGRCPLKPHEGRSMKEASSLKTIRIRNLKKSRQVIDGGPSQRGCDKQTDKRGAPNLFD